MMVLRRFSLLVFTLSVTAIGGAVHGDSGGRLRNVERRTSSQKAALAEERIEAQSKNTTRALQNVIVIPDWGYPSSDGDPSTGGFAGVDFAYQSVAYQHAATGMSYYLRAFDMFPRHYTNQLGWGQWVKPNDHQKPGASCPLNPHNLVCYPADKEGPNPFNDGPAVDCTWPEGDSRLGDCSMCDNNIVYGGFEGGMGYWPYTTGHSGVKFMAPSSVSGSYHKYGGHFLPRIKQPVSKHSSGSTFAVHPSTNLYFRSCNLMIVHQHGRSDSNIKQSRLSS